jgi:hypothetical protein
MVNLSVITGRSVQKERKDSREKCCRKRNFVVEKELHSAKRRKYRSIVS